MRKWCLWAMAMALLVAPALGACPNKCSGHGRCGINDVCECMQNWIGGDCSLRQCQFTRAWADTAVGDNDAHYYKECGNRGTCDRDKGVCDCDAGFTGSGCRRMICPEDCSGHGVCDFIEELAKNSFDKAVGGSLTTKYELWDQEKIMGCRCDPGYEGHNCARRTCPKGDDQLTTGQVEMNQAIYTANTGSEADYKGYLTYFDPYGNAYTTSEIKFDSADVAGTCTRIQTELRRLPNNVLNNVKVTEMAAGTTLFTRDSPVTTSTTGTVGATPTALAAKETRCVVQFRSEPGNTGYQHLLGCNIKPHADKGQQPMSVGLATASCTVTEVQVTATVPTTPPLLTELAECSGRGLCDYNAGICKCYTGHMGLACERQEALV